MLVETYMNTHVFELFLCLVRLEALQIACILLWCRPFRTPIRNVYSGIRGRSGEPQHVCGPSHNTRDFSVPPTPLQEGRVDTRTSPTDWRQMHFEVAKAEFFPEPCIQDLCDARQDKL